MKQWPKLKTCLKGYDIIQLNNDYPLNCGRNIMLYILHYVFKHNNARVFLYAWGNDYVINLYECRNNLNLFQFMSERQKRLYVIKQFIVRAPLNRYVLKHVDSICPGMYGYKLAYANNSKTCDRIFPFAIGKEKIGKPLQINPSEPIVIFHGWQTSRENKKEMMSLIESYGGSLRNISNVLNTIVRNVPYEKYCKLFSSSHIFIDQLYADDKGMYGLLGMGQLGRWCFQASCRKRWRNTHIIRTMS